MSDDLFYRLKWKHIHKEMNSSISYTDEEAKRQRHIVEHYLHSDEELLFFYDFYRRRLRGATLKCLRIRLINDGIFDDIEEIKIRPAALALQNMCKLMTRETLDELTSLEMAYDACHDVRLVS